MSRILLSIAAMGMLTAANAPSSAALDYSFTVSIKDGQLSVQHRILNRSKRAVCFFPDSLDIDRATLRGSQEKKIPNIHNSGYVVGRQIVYFAAPDGMTHLFSYSAELDSVFRPVEDAGQVKSVEYEFYGFDCNDLTSGRSGIKPIVRKTATGPISPARRTR